ncbi:MAG TPA: hypothetical protein VIP09_11785 [Dehalococcoidia bacterium]
MTRIGATGHQDLPVDALKSIVAKLSEILNAEALHSDLVGYTSLAAGADQLFARMLVDAHGELRVIVPSAGYEQTFNNDRRALKEFNALLKKASEVERLPFERPTEEAFFAAGKRIVDSCDTLIAIWDGKPARGVGGTADVVAYARSTGKAVSVIWPAGVSRP